MYEYQKERRKSAKPEVLNAYGNQCACCGEKRREFLTIDHIEGGGNKHRRGISQTIYEWLKINKYPSGFQLLCMNCNWVKAQHGYCPHEWERLYPMIYAEQDIDLTQWAEVG